MSDYNIVDFGAVADGKTLNTPAIQKAIDACHKAGGGRVICGAGVFVTGSLVLKSNVEFHLMRACRLMGSDRLVDYRDLVAPGFIGEHAPEKSANSLIIAVEAENIAVTGPGEIRLPGPAFYDQASANAEGKFSKPPTPRPRAVMFYGCRHVRLEDVSLVDAPCWTCWLMKCAEMNIVRVKIRGNRRMRNNDGIDIDACRNVTISDCLIDTEDDCLVLRAIQQVHAEPAVCENVTVTNCVFRSQCKGILIGCPGDAVIRNCSFSNIVIHDSTKGIAIENPKCYLPKDSRGSADIYNIVFSNIVIDRARIPIVVYVEEGVVLKRLSDLSFSNIRIKSAEPCRVEGSSETIVRNVSFNNIDLETSGADAIVCRHCAGVRLADVNLSNLPAAK